MAKKDIDAAIGGIKAMLFIVLATATFMVGKSYFKNTSELPKANGAIIALEKELKLEADYTFGRKIRPNMNTQKVEDSVNSSNYNRIDVGMGLGTVRAILGSSDEEDASGHGFTINTWKSKEIFPTIITVIFQDGKASSKAIVRGG